MTFKGIRFPAKIKKRKQEKVLFVSILPL